MSLVHFSMLNLSAPNNVHPPSTTHHPPETFSLINLIAANF